MGSYKLKFTRSVFIIFCLGTFVACSSTTKLNDFNPKAPVEVHRTIINPGLYQNGELFETHQFHEHYKNNSEYISNHRLETIFFLTGLVLSGAGGWMIGDSSNSDNFMAGLGVLAIGLTTSRYSARYHLNNGDLHNRILKEQNMSPVSQFKWQFSF